MVRKRSLPQSEGKKVDFIADEILVASGRGPVNDILHPEKGGIKTDPKGWIIVNEYLETTQPNIWAFGDADGKYLFKHVANYESKIVFNNAIMKQKIKVDYHAVPYAVFSYPEIAGVGMGEKDALEKYGAENILIGFHKYEDTAKGQAMDVKDYFVKIIFEESTDRILGAHIIGPYASILIQEIVNLMYTKERKSRIHNSGDAYPSCIERSCPEGFLFIGAAGTLSSSAWAHGAGIRSMSMIVIGNSRIHLSLGDITEQRTDAIVNAANSTLMGGGGVDGAIHRKGGTEILEECRIIRKTKWPEGLPTGEAVVTTGGKLKAKMVIHTVGPIWKGGNEGEPNCLLRPIGNCLALALKMNIRSISFPSISTGAYGYPIEKASRIALSAVLGFIKEHNGIDEVHFVLHSQHDLMIYEAALKEVIQTGFTGLD